MRDEMVLGWANGVYVSLLFVLVLGDTYSKR